MPGKRPLKTLDAVDLMKRFRTAQKEIADILHELTHRSAVGANHLFREIRDWQPRGAQLEAEDATRHHSVYVIELKEEVHQSSRFGKQNPSHVEGSPCYYVGMTGLTPEERFAQHRRGEKANGFARDFGRRLRPDLYERRNPLTWREAVIEEVALARELRAEGCAVWQK